MADLLFSLEATIPVFLVMVAGFILMRLGLFNENFTKTADNYVFKCALPIAVVLDLAGTDLSVSFSWDFVGFCFFGTLCMFLFAWGFSHIYLRRHQEMIAAFAMSSARGSAAVLGVAFAENIFGNSTMTALMIMASVPLYNIFSVIFLTVDAPKDGGVEKKGQLKKVLIGIATNPLIISVFLGILLALLRVKIPVIPYKALKSIGGTATPIALLSIGAGFDLKKAMDRLRPALVATMMKLMILPAIFLPLAVRAGFRGPALIAILTMSGSPTTVACYIMAKNMKGDHVLTSSIVMLSTLLSAASLTFWVYILKSHGLL